MEQKDKMQSNKGTKQLAFRFKGVFVSRRSQKFAKDNGRTLNWVSNKTYDVWWRLPASRVMNFYRGKRGKRFILIEPAFNLSISRTPASSPRHSIRETPIILDLTPNACSHHLWCGLKNQVCFQSLATISNLCRPATAR